MAQFCDQIGVIFGGKDIMERKNVWYIFEFFKDLYFRVEKSAVDFVLELFEVDDFDCDWNVYIISEVLVSSLRPL